MDIRNDANDKLRINCPWFSVILEAGERVQLQTEEAKADIIRLDEVDTKADYSRER